jgi:hypothetical protein
VNLLPHEGEEHNEGNKNITTREIKRLELQIARLTNKLEQLNKSKNI